MWSRLAAGEKSARSSEYRVAAASNLRLTRVGRAGTSCGPNSLDVSSSFGRVLCEVGRGGVAKWLRHGPAKP